MYDRTCQHFPWLSKRSIWDGRISPTILLLWGRTFFCCRSRWSRRRCSCRSTDEVRRPPRWRLCRLSRREQRRPVWGSLKSRFGFLQPLKMIFLFRHTHFCKRAIFVKKYLRCKFCNTIFVNQHCTCCLPQGFLLFIRIIILWNSVNSEFYRNCCCRESIILS